MTLAREHVLTLIASLFPFLKCICMVIIARKCAALNPQRVSGMLRGNWHQQVALQH